MENISKNNQPTVISQQISSRTHTITFDDGISLLLICGDRYDLLCDTHLGPESMDYVNEYRSLHQDHTDLVIFNSHSDWDHIWGNCAFPDAIIIAHESCRERMQERGSFDLSRNLDKTRGKVTLRLPNLTFETRMSFENEDIMFIHAPGHTVDSSLCFDRRDQVLYVGDLIEDPIPYLDFEDLDTYIETLAFIRDFPAKTLLSAHSGIVNRDLIDSNIRYIRNVQAGIPINSFEFGEYNGVHRCNCNTLLMFRYEHLVRKKLKDKFDFSSFWSIVSDLSEINYGDLKRKLEIYLSEL